MTLEQAQVGFPPQTASFHERLAQPLMEKFAALIYRRIGVRLSSQKNALLSNRLRRRLHATGHATFEAYYEYLKRMPLADAEWNAFLQVVTTHETYLYRDLAHWLWFEREYLPRLAAEAAAGKRPRTLRVWSAACSTGDEVYTLAACVAAALKPLESWNILILGTDVASDSLALAERGVFNERAMRLVPKYAVHRFFTHNSAAQEWSAGPTLRSLVRFESHNLLEPLAKPAMDLVVMKNVLIYFDRESKQRVVQNIRRSILPGGLLLAGAAEGISDLVADFERVQPWLYRWQGGRKP